MQLHCPCISVSRKVLLSLWCNIALLFTATAVTGTDYYCEDGATQNININNGGNTTGIILTLLKGETYYDNNRFCQWVLDSGSDNKRILLTVLDTSLQWAPESAICTGGYDYVHVKDGPESSTSTIVLWCGSRNPYTVTSSGRQLTVTFQSDNHNPYKYTGAQIKFETFDSNSCPLEWTSPMTSDPYCYKIMTHTEMWNNAQKFCNYNQANLIVISTEKQQNFIKDLGQTSSDAWSTAWLGLSKIASESTLKWINGSEVTVQYFATQDHKTDEDCVLIDFDNGEWQTQHCSRLSVPFICQTNKRGETTIYPVPEGSSRKEVESQSNIAIILAGVLGSLVVIAGIITAIIVYLKCFKKKNQKRRQQSYRSCDNDNQSDNQSSSQPVLNPRPRPARAVQTQARAQPSAPSQRDLEGSAYIFADSTIAHAHVIAPPSYDEVIMQKGSVDVL